jgi:hypothetical protein
MFARIFALPSTERKIGWSIGVCARGCGCCIGGCPACKGRCGAVPAADVGAEVWGCGGQFAGRKGLDAPVPRGGTDEGRGIDEGG